MKFSKDLLKGVAPFIIIQVLNALHEAYGYQLLKAVRQESKDVFDFPDSTLYPILYRLEGKGLVISELKSTENKKDRRYYKVTEEGKKWLAAQEVEFKIYHEALQHFLGAQAF